MFRSAVELVLAHPMTPQGGGTLHCAGRELGNCFCELVAACTTSSSAVSTCRCGATMSESVDKCIHFRPHHPKVRQSRTGRRRTQRTRPCRYSTTTRCSLHARTKSLPYRLAYIPSVARNSLIDRPTLALCFGMHPTILLISFWPRCQSI